MALNRYVLTATVTMPWPATWSEIIQGGANSPMTAPAIPASPASVVNGYPLPALAAITGGTVSSVTVNGATLATASPASVIIPVGATVVITYSVLPTWTWTTAELPQSGSSSMVVAVSAAAPAGGQAGTIPAFTWQRGMPLLLDPAGLLYAAIGAGNLRAWTDGTDNVGHASISN
jgi:hypothetical protein